MNTSLDTALAASRIRTLLDTDYDPDSGFARDLPDVEPTPADLLTLTLWDWDATQDRIERAVTDAVTPLPRTNVVPLRPAPRSAIGFASVEGAA